MGENDHIIAIYRFSPPPIINSKSPQVYRGHFPLVQAVFQVVFLATCGRTPLSVMAILPAYKWKVEATGIFDNICCWLTYKEDDEFMFKGKWVQVLLGDWVFLFMISHFFLTNNKECVDSIFWVMHLRILIYTLFTYQLRVKQDQRNKEQNKTPLHPKCANICTIYDVTRFKSGFRSWNLNTIVKLVRQICGGKPSFCGFGWLIMKDIFPI